MKISYDPECEKLARFFIEADDSYPEESDVQALASVIQKAIEDWFEEREPGFEARQEPDDVSGQGE